MNAAASAAEAPIGTSALTLAGRQAESAAEHRRDARADLHGGPFAAEGDAARESDGAEPELAEHRAQADEAVANEERDLGLRDAAAARVGEVAGEQNAGRQSDPTTGITRRRHAARSRDRGARPSFSVRRMKATTTSPTTAPMMSVRTRRTLSS